MKVKVYSKKQLKKGLILRRVLIAGTLALTIGTTAIVGPRVAKNDKKDRAYSNAKTEITYVSASDYIREDDDYVEVTNRSTPISMNEEKLNSFREYVDSIETDYPITDLIEIETALARESSFKSSTSTHPDLRSTSGKIQLDTLVNTVVKNSDAYYENLGSMKSFYTKMTRSEISAISEIIIDTIEKESEINNIDIKTISHKLSALKMFKKSGSVAIASMNSENVFTVNDNMLNVASIIANEQNAFVDTVIHETEHIIQGDIPENVDAYHIGPCFRDKSLDINPLYWSWYIEASAEKSMMNLTGDENITYASQINYLESIAYALTLNDDYNVGDLEKITLTKDREKLMNLLGLDRDEFISLMYAVEIIQTESKEFDSTYENKTGSPLDNDTLVELKRKLKGAFTESLAKVFYKNLASQICTGKLDLESSFYLIKIFEADAFSHIRYDEKEKLEMALPYLVNYAKIQNAFWQSLESLELTNDEIAKRFDEYSTRVIIDGSKMENCNLTQLEKDKTVYIEKRKDSVYSKTVESIVNTVNRHIEKNYN